jgi:calcium-dependent protein kinase
VGGGGWRGAQLCHAQGIVHRDISADNFVYLTADADAPVRAIDFGLATFLPADQRLHDRCGTVPYCAPELLSLRAQYAPSPPALQRLIESQQTNRLRRCGAGHRYGQEADMWSVGVLAYQLLTGSLPFSGAAETLDSHDSAESPPQWDTAPRWGSVSLEARAFVRALLVRHPLFKLRNNAQIRGSVRVQLATWPSLGLIEGLIE